MGRQEKLIKFLMLSGDIVLMYVALFLTLVARYGDLKFLSNGSLPPFLMHFSLIYLFWVVFLFALDFYEISPKRFIPNLVVFSCFALFSGVTYFYFKPQLYFTPKTILVLDVIVFDILFVLFRQSFKRVVFSNLKEKVIMMGTHEEMKDIIPWIPNSGYQVAAVFADQYQGEFPFKIVSDRKELHDILEKEKISFLAINPSPEKYELIGDILTNFPSMVSFLNLFEFYELLSKKVRLSFVDEAWVVKNISPNQHKLDVFLKRIFDMVLASLFFIALMVLFPFIAIAIKLDSKGPIFYRQARVGKNGKIFAITKFRTMQDLKTESKEIWREKDQKEITRVGNFLRRFHLDELPQVFSILKGDLSFVGPRPEWTKIADIFEKEIPFYRKRYLVKPGFTGWAQINYRASNSVEEARQKFEYDLYYIKNRSLTLDAKIVLKTIRLILQHKM
jgi:exopolysaccharide biosynthesis polyprenyl glycosylphosphotransferase